jgi:Zn-finger protein
MENSYRFYRNTACDYFPCHKVKNEEDFNCMFCYCPLYFLEECGGNYIDNQGIKDCTNCLIPHSPNGYDYINKKIMAINSERMRKHNSCK